jgi:very-short-patch-repair endonuclease
VRARAIRLVEYLEAVRGLRELPVRDVAEYRDKRWWAGDMPAHPACTVTTTGAEPWLRVAKAQVPAPPEVPALLAGQLVTEASDPDVPPAFAADFDTTFFGTLGESEQLHEALAEYTGGPWAEWAERAKAARQARALYEDLFELRQRLQRDSALIELVWGHAILSWLADGTRIVHPLITTQVQLSFDTDTGAISVIPEALVSPHMEIDLLQGLRLSGFDLLVDARERFREAPAGPFDPAVGHLHEQLIAALGPDAQLAEEPIPKPPTDAPRITATWVLLVRRRSTMYQRFFSDLRDALADGRLDVPAPLVAVVADELNAPGTAVDRGNSGSGEPGAGQPGAGQPGISSREERLLMPLPTNPEQEAVARRLAEYRGVTVQGPPGTGKTHTIANLISHLVGHGKRVLVTSQKEQALGVLRDKIPAALRDLSVAVLGSSATSLAQLDQSVTAIYENAVALDRVAARARMRHLDQELTDVQHAISDLRTRLSASLARERDQYVLSMVTGSVVTGSADPGSADPGSADPGSADPGSPDPGMPGTAGGAPGTVAGTQAHTPSTLGSWLAAHEAVLGYIPDVIAPGTACPLSGSDIIELSQLARGMNPADRAHARLLLPQAEHLPSPASLAATTADLRDLRGQLAGTESAVHDRMALERLETEELAALTGAVERAAGRLAQLEQPWLVAIRAELRMPSFAAFWRDQIKAIGEGIEELTTWRGQLLGHTVVLPDTGGTLPAKLLIAQLSEIRDRLAAGRGVSKTFQRELHRTREACLVDEEPPRTADDVDLCLIEARSRRRRYELIRRWNDAVGRVGGPMLSDTTRAPEFDLTAHRDALDAAFDWADGGWQQLHERLHCAGIRAPEQPAAADLDALAGTLRIAALHSRETQLQDRLDAVATYLAGGAAQPRSSQLWRDLDDALAATAWEEWGRLTAEVRRITSLSDDVERFDELALRLAAAAPVWAGQLTMAAQADPAVSQERAVTAARAWAWRQAATWLDAIINADDPAALQRQLEARLRTAAKITADLAAQAAWLGVAERLTDAERRGLTAWSQALRKVGKGTGKYAAHWRTEAQKAMKDAQTAVPVWIMPAHRVVESFEATARFDVVIMDESSQADIFALAALALADKAVIVGDDKQISPQAIGIDESAVHDLIRQHIPDLPQSGLLDIKSSLYDLAKMRFPGVIMLREHFRCLPEIVEFSNQLSYSGQILPLREQVADPDWRAVIDVQVPDGFRDRDTDTNLAEADFIVATITKLCADPAYDGKTFGVISLLGEGQAALIESRLVAELGEKEMERRKVRCGNAYHFQGDERHVIFLSLVVSASAGRRIGAMTKESDRQRVNVAASRAQDQLWCVHSISLDDLHPEDARARLIRHCQHPSLPSPAEVSFDSDFERDVYRDIAGRGYRVITQYRVGRYRIDMVIEGRYGSGSSGSRLAVELDGDGYHGAARWEADRQRQAILERLGWSFHRIRGSAYYRNPGTALAPLWDRLESMGIRPAAPPSPADPGTGAG